MNSFCCECIKKLELLTTKDFQLWHNFMLWCFTKFKSTFNDLGLSNFRTENIWNVTNIMHSINQTHVKSILLEF